MAITAYLPLSLFMIGAAQSVPACSIAMTEQNGVVSISATTEATQTGQLSYTVSATVAQGSNRSRTLNGGDIDVRAGAGTVTIWTGVIAAQTDTRIDVAVIGDLNGTAISCRAAYP